MGFSRKGESDKAYDPGKQNHSAGNHKGAEHEHDKEFFGLAGGQHAESHALGVVKKIPVKDKRQDESHYRDIGTKSVRGQSACVEKGRDEIDSQDNADEDKDILAVPFYFAFKQQSETLHGKFMGIHG